MGGYSSFFLGGGGGEVWHFLWTEMKSRSIKMQKRMRPNSAAILTEQAWSIKGLLFGQKITPKNLIFAETKQAILSGQDRPTLPALVANQNIRWASSCLLASFCFFVCFFFFFLLVDCQGFSVRLNFTMNLFVSLCSALKQIRDHLDKGHHIKALAVLKAAMVTWPEYSMFVTPERDEEQQEDEERYSLDLRYSLNPNHCS